MGIFGRGKSDGLMNVIRCDEPDYLIWKWRPKGQDANTTSRENAIRYGSSLRVKDGEVAVFVYKQKDGPMQDFIMGPYDDIIKTSNFPVLASIVGMAYGGESPFQAEVYYINLANLIQVKFGVPFFDVYDPRFTDFHVPVTARGSMTFSITDYKAFIKLHRLIDFSLDTFRQQVKDAVTSATKECITNTPAELQIPVIQLERQVKTIGKRLHEELAPQFEEHFGVTLHRLDLVAIEPDKESPAYRELRAMTADIQRDTILTEAAINLENLREAQRLNRDNLEETLRIQREEGQRAQRLQTESNYIAAHALNQQTSILREGIAHVGEMGTMNLGGGDDGKMNPAGMMTGMMMGSSIGQQMASMMNQMSNAMNGQYGNMAAGQFGNTAAGQPGTAAPGTTATPPPPPTPSGVQYHLSFNGQQFGPFSLAQLQQLCQQGQLTAQTYAWKPGMATWEPAGTLTDLAPLFQPTTPPPPPQGPQTPPPPPTA